MQSPSKSEHRPKSRIDVAGPDCKGTANWPLTFKIQTPQQQTIPQSLQHQDPSARRPATKQWWSHKLYRGPDNKRVQILYSKTIQDSEVIARQFLAEDVVGFDMEWPWNDGKRSDLQNKIGLIQIASEDKVALFHIGLHVGKTTDDILAPSLRRLIEDSGIGKLGVSVLHADFARLHRFFHLKPKGAVELSHLYRLVKYGKEKPELVSTKLVSLARLVEDQLGRPLYKGDVRTSNWSRPLSKDQIDYAASDAYAGLMLYRYLNFKRLQMDPVPPMPIHADKYLAYKLSGVIPLRLAAHLDDGSMMTSETFFGVSMDQGANPTKRTSKKGLSSTSAPTSINHKLPKELTEPASQSLYSELFARRAALAEEKNLRASRITTNAVLVALALERPTTHDQLLTVKGIGKRQQEAYGAAWLEVILKSTVSKDSTSVVSCTTAIDDPLSASSKQGGRKMSRPNHTRGRVRKSSSASSSPAFETRPRLAPPLHTGLSFTLDKTSLSVNPRNEDDSTDSDGSLPSLDFGVLGSEKTPRCKRKRTENPSLDTTQSEISVLQHTNQNRHSGRSPPEPRKLRVQHLSGGPSCAPGSNEPPSMSLKIARNKLQAFSRRVAGKLSDRPTNAPPIVSERTLSLIVVRGPQTQDELERIPGIDAFLLACQKTNTDLLRNILKLAPARAGTTQDGTFVKGSD